MPIPGVNVVTARPAIEYMPEQLKEGAEVAWAVGRGVFVYCMPPLRDTDHVDSTESPGR